VVAEILPAVVRLRGERAIIANTVKRVPECWSGMKNLSGLRVIGVRVTIPFQLDEPNVIFNPEPEHTLRVRYGPNTITPVNPSVTNDAVHQPFFGEQPSYDFSKALHQENIPGDDKSPYLCTHVDELGRGLCKGIGDCDGIFLVVVGNCNASAGARKSYEWPVTVSGSSGRFT